MLGSLGLAVIGFAVDFLFRDDPQTAAHLLRYYWFRMSDFAVPLGFSLVCSRLLLQILDPLKTAFFRELQGNFSAETIVIAVRKWAKTFLVLFFGSFCVFLLVNGFLFDCNHAFWNPPPENAMKFLRERPPEPGISWGLTLLSGIIVLLLGPIFRRKKLNNGLENRVILCGWLLLFGSVLIWNPAVAVISLAKSRTEFSYSQSDPQQSRVAYCWRDVCEWINDPENAIAAEARFLTPQDAVSFKWLTRRPEVAVWKEVPQDAAGIVQWYSVMEEIYLHKDKNGVVHREYPVELLLHRSSPQQFRTRMNFLRDKYRFDYILCGKFRRLNLPLEYENAYFVVYRVPEL